MIDMPALELALAAVDSAYGQPPRARRLAGAALAAADGDPEPAAVAERALGMAGTALGELATGETHLRAAIAVADGAGLASRAAEARASLSYLLALGGRTGEALAELDRAAAVLRGVVGARVRMQRALVLSEAGRFAEAAAGYDAALAALRRAGGDPVVEGDLRNNRSVLRVQARDWRGAADDLRRAADLYAAAGQEGKLATVHHNRGLAAAVRGDLPAALAAFDEAAELYAATGRDPGLLGVERAEALLSVLLVADARRAAAAAVEQFAAQRNAVDLVQARLVLARAALLDGDPALAAAQADRARRAALAQQRPGWAALAGYLSLRARSASAGARAPGSAGSGSAGSAGAGSAGSAGSLSAGSAGAGSAGSAGAGSAGSAGAGSAGSAGAGSVGSAGSLSAGRPVGGSTGGPAAGPNHGLGGASDRGSGDSGGEGIVRAGRRTAAALAAAGWVVEAADARLIVARAALALGRPATARRTLAGLDPDTVQGPAELRARLWHARALLRLSEGDGAGAEAALRSGMAVLDRFRASLGATELRVHAAGHAGELAALGVRLAVAAGDAGSVLDWSERWRAGALLLRRARSEDAPELTELRQVVAEAGAAAAAGTDTAALRARQATLEEAVRRRALRSRGTGVAPAGPVPVDRLRTVLGPAALVEYVAVDGELHAVVVTSTKLTLHRLGPLPPVERDLTALRYGLRRLLAGSAGAAPLVADKADRLERALLRPLRAELADRPLVLVPTGALHALPWGALPGLADRPIAVAPSAALWYRAAAGAAPIGGRLVLAAGPDLPYAAAEVADLAARHPDALRLTGPDATVAAVTRALDGAGLAHVAAHGRFRADNPLFSALSLVDGPLTVHDLERLDRPPRQVVLSACESGLSAVHPGDELVGLAAALLALGVGSLVGSVVPVPDEASRPVMLSLHRHLRDGLGPAAALMLARREQPDRASASWVAAAGFVCFGAGGINPAPGPSGEHESAMGGDGGSAGGAAGRVRGERG